MISETKMIAMDDDLKLCIEIKEKDHSVWFIGLHGVGEHRGRHSYLFDLFGHKYNMCLFDLRGHGDSEGERAYIDDFKRFALDLKVLLEKLRAEYRVEKYILFGHSMGALIVSDFIQNFADDQFYPEQIFLSAPPIGFGGPAGKIIKYFPLRIMSKLAAGQLSVPLGGMVDLKNLSHDPRVYETYMKDEKCILKLHSRLLLNMVLRSREVYSKPLRPKCPAYCAAGGGDQIIRLSDLKNYFAQVEKSFIFEIFPEAYHEMHSEIKKYHEGYFSFLSQSLLPDED